MLESLRIRNIAVIESADITFESGLNILSGETGAGKSIVIEAISLLLGGRVSTDLLRTGCDEATVEGLFDTQRLGFVKNRMRELGFEAPATQNELLIKRTVNRSGKNRIFINGQTATLSMLQQLAEGLVDLCSQHEHQSLAKSQTQLDLLDRYGGHDTALQAYRSRFEKWSALCKERDASNRSESERLKRIDFLRYQLTELTEASFQAGEESQLEIEKQLLQSAEGRSRLAQETLALLTSDHETSDGREPDRSGLESLRAAASKMRALVQLDSTLQSLAEGLDRAVAETEEACQHLNRYLGSAEISPDRLVEVQDRLSLIAELKRKHAKDFSGLLALQSELEEELLKLEHHEQNLAELSERIVKLEAELRKDANALSKARAKAAQLLSDSVTGELKDLKMGEAKLVVSMSALPLLSDWSLNGSDVIQYQVQTNAGDQAKPIGKIASGGELSRLMLAIRRVISDRGGIGVYLFDEIDAGMSGQTAFQVGKKLKSVSKYNQVICITHLPQVAAFANSHWAVVKAVRNRKTQTEVVELSGKSRKEELARMLGGPELTRKSLDNAAELLDIASA